jgi:hypothetical protein
LVNGYSSPCKKTLWKLDCLGYTGFMVMHGLSAYRWQREGQRADAEVYERMYGGVGR